MVCPSEEQIAAFFARELPATAHSQIELHLDGCDACAMLIADFVRVFADDGKGAHPCASAEATLEVEAPPALDRSRTASELQLGPRRIIGRYEVRRLIGTGAMGAVYVAYDPQLAREVAIKILRNAAERDAVQERRLLQREAQVLARLCHPNVISVHDVGLEEDHVFIAMEYVPGMTLRAWSRQHRSWSDIREVFLAAGRGLAAAHAAGIVHRDFKPDNVLIGSDGRVRVTDFGLARVKTRETDPTLDGEMSDVPATVDQTSRRGGLLGTPAYMAPERFDGVEADTASDQFSFCVTLHEAIYGVSPFAAESLDALTRSVRAGLQHPPPRKRGIPRAVRLALRRGLSAHPQDRFPSMEALLEVIEGKHSALAKGAVAAICVGATFAVLSWERAPDPCRRMDRAPMWSEPTRAAVREVFASDQRGRAREAAELERSFTRYVERWKQVRTRTCEGDQALENARVQCLERARDEFDALVGAVSGAAPEQLENAGFAAHALPRVDTCYEHPHSVAKPVPADPVLAARVGDLRLRLIQAQALEISARPREAKDLLPSILEDAEALGYKPLIAEAHLAAAGIAITLDEASDARAALQSAVVAATSIQYRQISARAWTDLVHVYGEMDHDVEAVERAAALAQAEIDGLGGAPDVEWRLWMNLGNQRASNHDLAGARLAYHEAMERLQALDYPLAQLDVENNLAVIEHLDARYEEAATHLRAVLAAMAEHLPPGDPSTFSPQHNLGLALKALGKNREAEALFRRVIEQSTAALGALHTETLRTRRALIEHLIATDRAQEAATLARSLVDEVRTNYSQSDSTTLMYCELTLVMALAATGQADELLVSSAALRPQLEAAVGPRSLDVAELSTMEAVALVAKGRTSEAVALLAEVVDIVHEESGASHRNTAQALGRLGEAQLLAGHRKRAKQTLERAVAVGRAFPGLEESVSEWQNLLSGGLGESRG